MTLKQDLRKHVSSAAKQVPELQLDRFPPLIIYSCFEDQTDQLSAAASTQVQGKNPATAELLTMPRRKFGSRPVEILAPTSVALYIALVENLKPYLSEQTRQPDAWSRHREFGREGSHSHVVELDFASCYELIDHADLQRELLLRSFEPDVVDALGHFLSGLGKHRRGLPQMLGASDQLADTYLSIVDRRLMRSGHHYNRFADDYRVLAPSWDVANSIIEEAADHARSLGLILSSEKTGIKRREIIDKDEAEASSSWSRYFVEASSDLAELTLIEGPYGTMELDVTNTHEAEATFTAYNSILGAWHTAFKTRESVPSKPVPSGLVSHLNRALLGLSHSEDELSDDLLVDLVFFEPTRLEHVCRYILGRLDAHRLTDRLADSLLARLTGTGRHTPWAKLWLLHVIARRGVVSNEIGEWVQLQLQDKHEIVRAEAAWTAAICGLLSTAALQEAYTNASEISQPALAAAAAKQDKTAQDSGAEKLETSTVRAIREDGPLNKGAYQWAS